MLVLLATLGEDTFPGAIPIDRLTERFADLARRYAPLREEVGDALDDPAALRKLVDKNPVDAWTGGRGTGGTQYFSYDGSDFSTTTSPSQRSSGTLCRIWFGRSRNLWRLTEYVRRTPAGTGADRFICHVSHAGGRPILFLPPREANPGIPTGWRNPR